MVYLRSIAIAALSCCLLGIQQESEAKEPFDVETKLTASDAAEDDWFGYSVAISGNTAIVGARYDDDGGSDSGSAYVFTP